MSEDQPGGPAGEDTWARLRRDMVVFEDRTMLALNKPPGTSLVGERHGTDLARMAKEAGERWYPVHRVDKVTSGLVVIAKNLPTHGAVTRQFARRSVQKAYLAVTRSAEVPDEGTVDLPLLTAGSGRIRVAAERARIVADEETGSWGVPAEHVFTHTRSYPSVTVFRTVARGPGGALLVVRPVTGRRHQIRVHLAWIGLPLAGDPLFDRGAAARGERTLLHSWSLRFATPWRDRDRMSLRANPRRDFWDAADVGSDAYDLRQAARAAYFDLDDRYARALAAATGDDPADGSSGDAAGGHGDL